jgi:hypothetical protein
VYTYIPHYTRFDRHYFTTTNVSSGAQTAFDLFQLQIRRCGRGDRCVPCCGFQMATMAMAMTTTMMLPKKMLGPVPC